MDSTVLPSGDQDSPKLQNPDGLQSTDTRWRRTLKRAIGLTFLEYCIPLIALTLEAFRALLINESVLAGVMLIAAVAGGWMMATPDRGHPRRTTMLICRIVSVLVGGVYGIMLMASDRTLAKWYYTYLILFCGTNALEAGLQ